MWLNIHRPQNIITTNMALQPRCGGEIKVMWPWRSLFIAFYFWWLHLRFKNHKIIILFSAVIQNLVEKIPLAFHRGDQGDANFRVALQKHHHCNTPKAKQRGSNWCYVCDIGCLKHWQNSICFLLTKSPMQRPLNQQCISLSYSPSWLPYPICATKPLTHWFLPKT